MPVFFWCFGALFGAPKAEILVGAASDLSPLAEDLAKSFLEKSGYSVRFTFASSGTLAQQIQNGAPFDVYLSANESFTKRLVASGHILGDSVRLYGRGRVGLWSKTGAIRTISDLLLPGVLHLALANPSHAPYGLAAKQVLEKRGVWAKLSGKIVYGENVRQALQYAESGNADAVITAWSLIFDKGGVQLPAAWHEPIRQTGAVVTSSKNPEAARRFLNFLISPEGRTLLGRFGLE